MCFSATASFGAAAFLGAMGVASLVISHNTSQRVLSGIPLVFAIQQFSEGFLWLSLQHSQWAHLEVICTYAFLIFAQVVWPIYVPFAIWLYEQDKQRKKIITILIFAGLVLSAYVLYALIRYPATAVVQEHHIRYILGFSLASQWYYGLLYFLPTILAPVISGNRLLRWLGYSFFISYLATRLLFHFYVISVWCFFGAIISIFILLIVRQTNNSRMQTQHSS